MSSQVYKHNVRVEVHQFTSGNYGSVSEVATFRTDIRISTVMAPRYNGCCSSPVLRWSFFWVSYAGKRYEVEKPLRKTMLWARHGWKITLPSGVKLARARA